MNLNITELIRWRRHRRCQQRHLAKPDATTHTDIDHLAKPDATTHTLNLTTTVTWDMTLTQNLTLTQTLTLTRNSTMTHNSTFTQNSTLTQIDFADKGFIIKTLFSWAFLVMC